jgi:hypothetical protein
MALKNYRSESTRSFEIIQQTLAKHRAKQIVLDYADNGRVNAIAFSLEIEGRLHAFRLPARVENVERILYGSRELTPAQKEQAYRTVWANIRDWITAQMALLDTGMVKPEEDFLPYMLTRHGQTYFDALQQNHFLLPSAEEARR